MKPALEPDTIVAHLDKSHVTVHTYPEYHPDTCLATFRVDIDVATCGEITPLSTLDYLIGIVRFGHYHDGLPRARLYARY